MSKVRTFIKDFSIVSLGNILCRFFAALISIVIARYLGPENFGRYSILFTVMVIISSGLSGMDFTYIYKQAGQFKSDRFSYSDYIFTKSSTVFIIVIIGIFSSPYLNKYVFNGEIATPGLIISFLSALSFVAFTQTYTFYQAREKFSRFSSIQVTFYFLVFLNVLLLYHLKINNYYLFLISYLIPGFAIFIPFLLLNRRELHLDKILFGDFIKKGKWIILSEIFIILIARLDFLILSHYIKGETLGFYSTAMYIVNIYLTFTAAFSSIMLPKASSIRNEHQKRQFYKASFILTSALTFLIIALILSSSIIVEILFGIQYLPAVKFSRLLLIAYIPFTLYLPFIYLTFTFNKTIVQFLVFSLQCLLLLLIGPFFITKLGPQGIIIAKAIVFIMGFLIFFITISKNKVPNDS